MRAILFLLLALVIHPACKNPSANIKLQNEKEVRKAISNKWETTYIEMLGSRCQVPKEQMQVYAFNEDGTYSFGVKDGVIAKKGEWNYDPKTQMLYVGEGKEKDPAKILKLTGKELILSGYMRANEEIVDSMVVTYTKL